MKGRSIKSGAVQALCITAVCLVGVAIAPASQLKEARVTQVVKDVKLLPNGAAPRAAVISDQVRDGTAVRTGVESRSELTFPDQTLARLGASTTSVSRKALAISICRTAQCSCVCQRERVVHRSIPRR